MMTLKRFRVTNFRSVIDSGWIDCDEVTTLVGINEAGKSNIILALWKLNPVRDGKIDPLHDMPTKEYSSWRSIPENVTFISADFELDSALSDKVISLCNCTREVASIVNIQRRYDRKYLISFPFYTKKHSIDVAPVVEIISEANQKLGTLKEKTKAEAGIKNKVSNFYKDTLAFLSTKDALSQSDTNEIKKMYPTNITKSATSEIYPHLQAIQQKLDAKFSVFSLIDPADNADVRKLMVVEMPAFVYYSNYGNLDAQIYLPHAIKWLKTKKWLGLIMAQKCELYGCFSILSN